MEKYNVNIVNNNESLVVGEQTTLLQLGKSCQKSIKGKILLARVDGKPKELDWVINRDCHVEFMDITYIDGFKAYQRSCVMLMLAAVHNLFGSASNVWIEHTLNKNFFCSIKDTEVTKELLKSIEDKMADIAEKDYKIEKLVMPVEDGLEIFKEYGMTDRIKSFRFVKSSTMTLYRIGNYYDYLYGEMVPSTGYLKVFKLTKADNGFLLRVESAENLGKVREAKAYPKLSAIYNDFTTWSKTHKLDTVSSLNSIICSGKKSVQELIWLSEGRHEKNIAQIAEEVYKHKKRLVMIAGPSSSSKTTFARRLCVQLQVMGLRPHIISLDNYYKNRAEIPLEPDGTRNFERLDSLAVDLFNSDLIKMLKGERVQIPEYNFYTGCRELNGNFIQLEEGDVVVIEGIHGINERLTPKIPREEKFKIYISCLTQLNIDEHNRISTTDTRLLRRLVRDYNFRGFDAKATIDMWPTVIAGEEENIFPFQEEADAMFSTSLDYELAVLKPYAESVLYKVDRADACYSEAKRLLNFLECFLTISPGDVPPNSLLREFIGGSCFYNN